MTTTAQWTAPGDVAEVVARMRALAAGLPAADGVAVFNRVYLAVTEEVTRRLVAGRFSDGPEAAELAVVFAGRYLAAVEGAGGGAGGGAVGTEGAGNAGGAVKAGGTPEEPGAAAGARHAGGAAAPACWQPLLRARADRGVHPLRFALAGITAHVGHDLALAVVDTCRATGRAPAAVAADYAEVGGVLTAIEVRVREELMPGPDLLERFDPLTHAVGSWSLARARDGAWAAARLLWAVRDRAEAYEDCVRGLDAAVGLMAHALLAPLAPVGPPRAPAPPPAPGAPGACVCSRPVQSSGSSTGAISS